MTIVVEDDSDSWKAQIQLEKTMLKQRQAKEKEERINTREILERLRKCAAILDLCDSRIEHLKKAINETAELLTLEDTKFRNELKKRLYRLL